MQAFISVFWFACSVCKTSTLFAASKYLTVFYRKVQQYGSVRITNPLRKFKMHEYTTQQAANVLQLTQLPLVDTHNITTSSPKCCFRTLPLMVALSTWPARLLITAKDQPSIPTDLTPSRHNTTVSQNKNQSMQPLKTSFNQYRAWTHVVYQCWTMPASEEANSTPWSPDSTYEWTSNHEHCGCSPTPANTAEDNPYLEGPPQGFRIPTWQVGFDMTGTIKQCLYFFCRDMLDVQ